MIMCFRSKGLIFLVFLLSSCGGSLVNIPDSSGQGSEIYIVAGKSIWDGPLGDTLRSFFMTDYEGLPEAEPDFKLVFIPEENFSKELKTRRDILFVDISSRYKQGVVETLENVWAHPQRVFKIKAGSDTAGINAFGENALAIKELYNQSARARCRALIAQNRNDEVGKILTDAYGIEISIPQNFVIARKTADFTWLRAETDTSSLGLFIYTMPYNDTSQLAPASVLDTRDLFTKRYIPNPSGAAYMMIEREAKPPVSHRILFKGMYALETRGLWRTRGDTRGGPFVNYTIVDASGQRIIVFDGFVYSPQRPKRNYMRQFESVIWDAEIGKEAGKE
jgi:hypothetical protein